LAAGDDCWIDTRIEGRRFARLRWGYANAQPLTIGFWSLHQRAGVWGGSVRNSAQTRSYAFTYTQAAAGAMQWNVITIPGDTFGGVATWLNDTGPGAIITFGIAVGSTYVAPAANTWYSANYHTPPGCVNGVAATTDVFGIMGFVALPGTEAPASDRAPYIMRPYDQELLLCQRYYQVSFIALEATTPSAGAIISASLPYKTPMRAVPTGTISTSFTSNANTPTFNSMNYYGGYLSALVPAAGRGYWYGIVFLDARI
jgi:hypothetical protein